MKKFRDYYERISVWIPFKKNNQSHETNLLLIYADNFLSSGQLKLIHK